MSTLSPPRTSTAVWTHEGYKALYVACDEFVGSVRIPNRDDREAAADAIRGGDRAADVFEKSGWSRDPREATSIQFNERGTLEMTLEFKRGFKEVEYKSLAFETAAQRDAAFAVIERATSETHTRSRKAYSRLRASLEPAVGLAIVAFMTWGLAFLEMDPESSARGGGTIRWVRETIGETTIVVLGSIGALTIAGWWMAWMRNPPIMVRLKRT